MSLLAYNEICELIERGVIKNTSYANVNGSSLDLILGDTFLYEVGIVGEIRMNDKQGCMDIDRSHEYLLQPGEFILAHTVEEFDFPLDVSGEYMLKSTMARNGLEHLGAGWADPGWNGVLTLEFKNMLRYHTIVLKPGMKCGQMKFFKHVPVPEHNSYKVHGQYNGDKTVSAGKGIK